MEIKALEAAGLTTTESKIYLNLLENGSSLAGRISRDTGIHRRSVYDAIERLTQKGLISYIKEGNKTVFEAVDPSRLLEIVKEKKDKIEDMMPHLNLMRNMAASKQDTLFFRGNAAIKTVFDDQLTVGEEVLIIAASVDVKEYLEAYFERFDKERKRKKLNVKLIFDEQLRGKLDVARIPLSEIRFAPAGFASPMSLNVYGNHVSMILWRESVALIIKEPTAAAGFRNYFNFMWSMAKK